MRLSAAGQIVASCWQELPERFPNTKVDTFQVMPNHLHGIIEMREFTGRGEVISPHHLEGDETSPLHKVTLGSMIAYFKYQATKHINAMSGEYGKKVFQRNYYDHIIRDDMDHFFVEQYIELNPIMWELDLHNLEADSMTIETLRRRLQDEFGLSGIALERIIDRELAYREWTSRNDSNGPDLSVPNGSPKV